MSSSSSSSSHRLLQSIPALWRASELGGPQAPVFSTGFAALDAELPGGGWPAGQLTELLQPEAGWREWRLLAPALAPLSQQGSVLLVGPPWVPYLPALASQGLRVSALRWVQAQTPAERLWAAEQALRCRDLAALLVWLPQCQASSLRRLHLAAQAGAQPQPPALWALRPWSAQHQSSPAPLRLGLSAGAADGLSVSVFKRRGQLLAQPLCLAAARPPALRPAVGTPVLPITPVTPAAPGLGLAMSPPGRTPALGRSAPGLTLHRVAHVVDRALARPPA
ncbi:translesion DNA synthesis-associated protein ImuA [Curvibacter sp. RS43]|uniref:translesion DNA synthesis-associated protein ImuA n=1 Tax=Curvibacter microcysteis TaxID=3026419 RepID=UPI00235EDF3A|nr:translesion DNA synthesis-associated protein ImuA [Curvibacter sp. RS43]MDD0808754.1 translesion DNA synthesis-associated protein ImuA [Curvibacter sp. RS43]